MPVEFLKDNPWKSRIAGTKSGAFSPMVLLVLLFPSIGPILCFFSLKTGWRNNQLLSRGRLTRGQLVAKEELLERENNRPVFRLTFEFEADQGRVYRAMAKTNEPERLEDEDTEAILYDPESPERSVLIDSLPASFHVDPSGAWAADPDMGKKALVLLVAPVVTMLEIAAYIAFG